MRRSAPAAPATSPDVDPHLHGSARPGDEVEPDPRGNAPRAPVEPAAAPGRDGDDGTATVLPLGAAGRRVRLLAMVIVFALITVGTVHGQDDDFPFGPMRMYATRSDPNGSVVQAVVLAVARSGRVRDVTNTDGAPRRAELEGRMSGFVSRPDQFAQVAPAFVEHGNATATDPEIRIELVRRVFALHDGRARPPVDHVVAVWTVRP